MDADADADADAKERKLAGVWSLLRVSSTPKSRRERATPTTDSGMPLGAGGGGRRSKQGVAHKHFQERKPNPNEYFNSAEIS